jgi:hypothetical protein
MKAELNHRVERKMVWHCGDSRSLSAKTRGEEAEIEAWLLDIDEKNLGRSNLLKCATRACLIYRLRKGHLFAEAILHRRLSSLNFWI